MATKQIKSSLKAAREAIRNREFKEALQHCKAVLSEDEENYMALVLIAVGAEGLQQFDQALKAYKRAIEADGTQHLAWQGLSSFYEKHPSPEHTTDRCNVYIELTQLYQGDDDKKHDCMLKLAQLIDSKTDPKVVEKVIFLLIDAERSESLADRITAIQKILIKVLEFSKIPDQKEKIQSLCKEVIGKSSKCDSDLESIISLYLAGISKEIPCPETQNLYSEIYDKFPSSSTALEYTITHYLDLFSTTLLSIDSNPNEDFKKLVDSYESQQSEGAVLETAKGYVALCVKDYITAKQRFTEALNQSTILVCIPVYLSWTSLMLHQNEAASSFCQQGIEVLSKKSRMLTVPLDNVVNILHDIQTQAWYSAGDNISLKKALQLIQKELNLEEKRNKILKGLLHIRLKEVENAKACLVDDLPFSAILEGQIFEEENRPTEALARYQQAVEMEPQNASFLLHLAKCQFKTGGLKKESFGNLIKAAKQDPFHSEIFLYLGHYYQQESTDMIRARKCYQKAFDLNPQNDSAGEALCDVLNKEGEEDLANKMLLSVTANASAGCGKWAWLRLGLYQLKHDDPSVAIASLQAALRADPSDTHVWECLGEAYYSRGSYTAALKAFNRASELNPDSMYCLFQMASIKQALAMHTEAVEEYKQILEKSPNYVPVLKGLGESYILIAKSYLSKYLHGRAREVCQAALDVLLRAAAMRPDLSCLWKLAGDSCTILHVLPPENFRFKKTDSSSMNKLETLQFGARCYIRAVKLYPECSSLWHDLGMNYFYQSKCSSNESGTQQIGRALQAIKKAVQLEPGNHRHWTALGFIACTEAYYRPDLAQHCFIKSIQAERNNAVAWTNLASLYLKHENVKLAHEAFKTAQSLEPSYVSCWIGQAIIAELVGHEDAMDLFRHTTDLGNHLEGALGYSHWVCTMLQSRDSHESYIYQYAIEQMAAVPASIDVLARYTDRVKTNPVVFNMYGLLLEKQQLFRTAAAQFKSAIELLNDRQESLLREVSCNYARVLCECEDYEASTSIYETFKDLDNFADICQSALAFYKCGKLEQSFQAYNMAAELAPTEADKSHVLTAVAMVIYKFGNADSAKTKLFESAQMSQPSVDGLKALCALGLAQCDVTLATAALQELYKLEDSLDIDQKKNLPLFTLLLDLLQGNSLEGLRKLQKKLFMNPSDHRLWRSLSTVLLRYFPHRGKALTNVSKTALVLEEKCQRLGYGMVALGQLSAGYHSTKHVNNNALSSAQRAVYLYPGDVENWVCLASAIHSEALLTSKKTRRQSLLEQESTILTFILAREKLSLGIKLWCHKQRTLCSIHANRYSTVLTSLQDVLEDFGTEKEVQQFFEVVQYIMKGDVNKLTEAVMKGDINNLNEAEMKGNNKLNKAIETTDLIYYLKVIVEMYIRNGLIEEAESAVKQYVSENSKSVLQVMLIHLAYGWYLKVLDTQSETAMCKFKELAQHTISLDQECSAIILLQGILGLDVNPRHSRYRLQDICKQEVIGHMSGGRLYSASVARRALIYMLVKDKKDAELIQKIANQAEEYDDAETMNYLKIIEQ